MLAKIERIEPKKDIKGNDYVTVSIRDSRGRSFTTSTWDQKIIPNLYTGREYDFTLEQNGRWINITDAIPAVSVTTEVEKPQPTTVPLPSEKVATTPLFMSNEALRLKAIELALNHSDVAILDWDGIVGLANKIMDFIRPILDSGKE